MLSVISFPAFAVEDKDLVKVTKSEIIGRLEVSNQLFVVFRPMYIFSLYVLKVIIPMCQDFLVNIFVATFLETGLVKRFVNL